MDSPEHSFSRYFAIDRRTGKLLSVGSYLDAESSDVTGAIALAGEVLFAGVQGKEDRHFKIEARDARTGKVLYVLEPELGKWCDDKLLAFERKLVLIDGLYTEKTTICVYEE